MGFRGESDLQIRQAEKIKKIGNIEIERGENGPFVGVTTRWGVKVDALALEEEAKMSAKEGEEIYPSGFTTLWQSSPELSMAEREEEELTAFTASLKMITNTPPAMLAVGSGSPIFEDYAGEMATRMGWTETITLNSYLACNSHADVLGDVMKDPRFKPGGALEGREVIVAGWEGLTRLVNYNDPKSTDPFSRRVFSNAGGLLKFVPGKDLISVADVFFSQEDVKGNLAAVMTYSMDPNGELVQTVGNSKRIRLPEPPPEMSIRMQPGPTGKMFIRAFEAGVIKLKTEYDKRLADEMIFGKPMALVTGHHPSGGPYEGSARRLFYVWGIGQELYPWVVYDGNSSGATSAKALNLHLGLAKSEKPIHIIQPGERIIFNGYGAGISYRGLIIDRGE